MRLVWKQLPLASNSPTAQRALKRSSNNLAAVGNKAYVYGGEAKPREPVDDELWVIDLHSEFSLSFVTHVRSSVSRLVSIAQLILKFGYLSVEQPEMSNQLQRISDRPPGSDQPSQLQARSCSFGEAGSRKRRLHVTPTSGCTIPPLPSLVGNVLLSPRTTRTRTSKARVIVGASRRGVITPWPSQAIGFTVSLGVARVPLSIISEVSLSSTWLSKADSDRIESYGVTSRNLQFTPDVLP